jgi:hypothetical protein
MIHEQLASPSTIYGIVGVSAAHDLLWLSSLYIFFKFFPSYSSALLFPLLLFPIS